MFRSIGLCCLLWMCLPAIHSASADTQSEISSRHIVLGSYTDLNRAETALGSTREKTQLSLQIIKTESGQRPLFRLVAGPISSEAEAQKLLERVRQATPDAWIDRLSGAQSAITQAIVFGSFSEREAADLFLERIQPDIDSPLMVLDARQSGQNLFRVTTVPTGNRESTLETLGLLKSRFPDIWVLRGETLHEQIASSGANHRVKPSPRAIISPSANEQAKPETPPAVSMPLKTQSTRTVVVDSKRPSKARNPANWVPPGFEDLLEPQTTQIDVYFGSVFLTSTLATYTPTEITLLSPADVTAQMSDALNPAALLETLTGPMPTNSDLVCLVANQSDCGSIVTDNVEVIFDESRFRMDLFLNQGLLTVRDVDIDRFLPRSSGSLAFLNQLSATINGAEGTDSIYNIGNSTTLAYKETRLLAISNFTRAEDFTVDTLALEREINGKLYQAGYFRSSAADLRFLTERDFAGVTMSASLDTRTDLDQSSGNDLQVFLDSRSRVDLLKDGRLISTAVYEPGNQIVDTSGLPGGAYDVLLRIRDSSGRTRDEIRFYVKTNQLPPIDQTLYFLDIGEVAFRELDKSLPQTNGDSLLRAGISKRISRNFGGQIGLMAIEAENILEIGVFVLGRSYEINLNVATGNNNDRGLSLGARYRMGGLTINTNYRRTWVDENRIDISLLDQKATQASLNLTIPMGRGALSLSGRYNKRGLQDADRNYGLRYDFPDYRIGRTALDTDLQVTQDNDDLQALLTFRLKLDRGNWRHEVSSQYYYDNFETNETEEGFINNVSSAWSDGERFKSDVSLSMRAVNERDDDTLETDFEMISDYGRMNADAVYSSESDAVSWGASIHTNIIANSDTFNFGGRELARSALVMNVEGQVDDAYFEVLVNGAPRANAGIGSRTVIGIAPYDTYEVSLSPLGDSIVDFNNQVQTATLYPGNVVTMDWKVARIVVAFGQLLRPDGTAVADALISNVTGIATTDEYGFFQAEIESNTRFVVAKTRTDECRAPLPEINMTKTVVMLQELVCE